MLAVTMGTHQKVTVTGNPVDIADNPTGAFNGPQWHVKTGANIVSLSTDNGDTCDVLALGPVGTATITISGQTQNFGEVKSTDFTVTTTPGLLDHFDPTATAPISQ